MKAVIGRPMGRLAFREEGVMWNAYYAMPDTMVGAVLLGCITLRFVSTQEKRDAFMALMKDCFAVEFKAATGVDVTWPDPPRAAPKHERGSHA